MVSKEQLKQFEQFDFQDILNFIQSEYKDQNAFCYFNPKEGKWVNVSTKQFAEDARRVASYIQKRFGKGNNIVISSVNTYAYVCMTFGIAISGNVVAPLDRNKPLDQTLQSMKMIDSSIALFESDNVLKNVPNDGGTYLTLQAAFEEAMTYDIDFEYEKDAKRAAIILATSGVTNNPKYVVLSQSNLIYGALNGMYRLPIDKGYKALSILPLSHVFENCCGLVYPLLTGGTIVQNDSPVNIKANIELHQPNFIVAVPSLIVTFNRLYHAEMMMKGSSCLSSVKYIIGGGAKVPPSAIKDFYENGIYVIQGYGLTETAASVAMNSATEITFDTVGNPMHFSDVKIVNEEILVKCPDVMLGYYKNPEATKAAFDGEYLKTGDTGYLDEKGNLVILGRLKNVIIFPTGEKVYPEEVEERIQANPGIDYCKVYDTNGLVTADIFSASLNKEQVEAIIAKYNETAYKIQVIKKLNVLSELPPVTALGKPFRRG